MSASHCNPLGFSLLFFALTVAGTAIAQEPVSGAAVEPTQQVAPPDPHHIILDTVVTPKSGLPVGGLQQSDFTILDNKVTQPIKSFQAFSGSQEPVEVVLLVDAVNTDYMRISYERQQIDNFLRANGGHLAHPTSLAIFTDTKTEMQPQTTTDGNALAAALDQSEIGLREIRRDSGFWGAEDRMTLSLQALQTVVSKEGPRPGRKVILWISPGWPYLSGAHVYLDGKQQQAIYAQIMSISTILRRAGITLYSVDPLGSGENPGYQFYYQEFLKGVSKPSQTAPGDLSLQVLAIQSGGLALTASNDIAGQIEHAIADLAAYYEISFDAPPGDQPNQYHQLEVRVDKPGVTAHTRTGYYSTP